MVRYDWFNGIYNGQMVESKNGEYGLPFDSDCINLLLNYIEDPGKFERVILTSFLFFVDDNTFPNLYKLANYVQIPELEQLCFKIMDSKTYLCGNEITLYKNTERNDQPLMDKLLKGHIRASEILPDNFLSKCFDYGMKVNKDATIMCILPIYCPTDAQMAQFTIAARDYKDAKTTANVFSIREKAITDVFGSRQTIEKFTASYGSNPTNLGAFRYIRELAKMYF